MAGLAELLFLGRLRSSEQLMLRFSEQFVNKNWSAEHRNSNSIKPIGRGAKFVDIQFVFILSIELVTFVILLMLAW